MMEIGIRDLKNGLSQCIKRVRGGETIVVTDRGQAVARIIPAGIPQDLEALLTDRRISWSGQRFIAPTKVPRPKSGRSLSEYVSEDRR